MDKAQHTRTNRGKRKRRGIKHKTHKQIKRREQEEG